MRAFLVTEAQEEAEAVARDGAGSAGSDAEDPESGSSGSGSEASPEMLQLRRLSALAAAGGLLGLASLALLLYLAAWSPQAKPEAVPDFVAQASSRSLDVLPLEEERRPLAASVTTTTLPPTPSPEYRIPQALAPSENRYDGNVCQTGEELFEGLCYKTCSLLTNGKHPIRTTPFSCCARHPCSIQNEQLGLGICGGFDVAGDAAGGGCPHPPGACLENEELSLGMCYKKCSLLTDNEFPHRVAAATCCKVKGLGCMDLRKTRTSKAFDVGGGNGDGDWSTPARPHPPLAELTEAASV